MISEKDQIHIREMIAQAEKKSHSELVPMIVSSSDVYPAAHFRMAIIVSFLFSLALYFSPLAIINPIYFLWIQIPGLLIGYYMGRLTFVQRLLVTKNEMEFETRQRAYEAFFEHNLHVTDHHNGVLIFISLMERKIRIVTDVGVRKKIDQKIWDELIVQFTEKVHQGDLASALKQTIEAAANVLEYYFPHTGTERANELKNDLIIE